MKKIFKTLAIVAVAALGFACQNEIDEQVNGNEGEKVTVEVVGTVADLTRSVFGETPNTQTGTVSSTWSGGEQVGFSVNGAALVSAENTDDAGGTASFSVEFDAIENGNTVYAFSPAATFGEIAEGVIAVNIPATQTPLATSVAENVHLLAAEATYEGGAMTMNFGHIAAYGKMNITGFDGEIESVAITFPNGVAGACEYDYVNEAWSGATEKTITLNGNQSSYWFGIAPTVVDDNITIVVAANGKTYTKKLFTAGKLQFIKGQVSNFTVNMTDIKEDVKVVDPETIDFTAQGYENQEVVESASSSNFTVTFDKGSNSNATKWYDSGSALRAYGGNTFTVSSENTISKIVLTYGNGGDSNAITTNVGTFSTDTWTGSANDVTFTIGGTSGNRRITSITVTFGAATAEDTREDQTLTFDTTNQTLVLYSSKTLQEQFVKPTLSGNKSFTKYSSSDESVATVDSEGNVTIVAEEKGSVTITATAVEDGDYKAAQASYDIAIVEPKLTNVEGNAEWAANDIEARNFTITGSNLEKGMLTLSGLTHFVAEVADDATAISIKPATANETDGDIQETLTITTDFSDAIEIQLTHKKPVVLAEDSFCKVTENLADFSGTYLIVYEDGSVAFDGSLDAIDATGNSVAVTIEDNAIKATAELGESIFTIAKVDGGYTIQSASGYYLGRTDTGNGMDESTTDAHKNTIEISNGVAVIKTVSYAPSLQYYKSGANSRFRYYATSQQAIQLYKLNGEIPEPLPALDTPTVTATASGNTIAVSWNAIVGAASYTVTCGTDEQTTSENNYTFEGLDYSQDYEITVVANPEDEAVNNASAAGTAQATTEADPNAPEPDPEQPGVPVTVTKQSFTSSDVNSGSLDEVISYTTAQNNATTAPACYNNGIRLYQNGNGLEGGSITFTAKNGYKITSVSVTSTSTYATTIGCVVDGATITTTESLAKSSTYTIEGQSASSVKISNYGNTSSKRLEIASVSVTYVAE